MESVTMEEHKFMIVESVPYNHSIWNIGKHMPDGYLPLVITGGYDGCQVFTNCMKAIKVKDAQKILSVSIRGFNTVKKMESFLENKENLRMDPNYYKRLEDVLAAMRQIKGVENLKKS